MYDFDKVQFSAESLRNDVGNLAPKLKALLENIRRLDEVDLRREGNVYKHFIFTDIKTLYGAKSIASVLIAHGMNLVITSRKGVITDDNEVSEKTVKNPKIKVSYIGGNNNDNQEKIQDGGGGNAADSEIGIEYGIIGHGGTSSTDHQLGGAIGDLSLKTVPISDPIDRRNFAVLTSSPLYKSEISVSLRKEIISTFNKRPDNIHGELIRFIIADSGYKEGIDLFDVKYVHIMEPQISQADLTQAIGRGTRKCGQAGLNFIPGRGWRLNVYVYNLELPKTADLYNYPDLHSLVMASSELNLGLINFHRELSTVAIQSAVDYDLNYKVNFFRTNNPTTVEIVEDTSDQTGGKRHNHRKISHKLTKKITPQSQLPQNSRKTVKRSTSLSSQTPQQNQTDVIDNPIIEKSETLPIENDPDETELKKLEQLSENIVKTNESIVNNKKIAPIESPRKLFIERKNLIDIKAINFSGYCGFRPTKDVPFVIREMRGVLESIKKTGVKRGFKNARDFYCALAEKYEKYANALKQYARDANAILLKKNPNARMELEHIDDEDDAVIAAAAKKLSEATQLSQPKRNSEISDEMKFAIESIKNLKKITDIGELQQFVINTYNRYAWESPIIENGCTDLIKHFRKSQVSSSNQNSENNNESPTVSEKPTNDYKLVTFTKSQDFIRHFLIPESPYRGILLWHSVGTGKTCAAVAAATTRFETQGYSILWVTRNTLVADIWKNIFGAVCSIPLQEKITAEGDEFMMPRSQTDRRRLLSRAWFKPITYKAFSNALKGRNELGQMLLKRNGAADILRKTIIIVDEVHKLYGGDLKPQEAPDVPAVEQAIWNSYATSGHDSVRLLLMSATPMTHNPLELVKILNLIQPTPEKHMPTTYREFSKKYLDEMTGKFTDNGRKQFQQQIFGLISYLNRENDPREFATIILRNVFVRINSESFKTFEQFRDEMMGEIISEMDNLNAKLAQCDMNDLEAEYYRQRSEIENAYYEYSEDKRNALTEFDATYKSYLRECRTYGSDYKKLSAKYDKTLATVEKKYATFLKKAGSTGNIINVLVDCLTKSSSGRHEPIPVYDPDSENIDKNLSSKYPSIPFGDDFAIETHIDDELLVDEVLVNVVAESVDTQTREQSVINDDNNIVSDVANELQGNPVNAPHIHSETSWTSATPEIQTEMKTEVANNIIDRLLQPGKNAIKNILGLPMKTRVGKWLANKIETTVDYVYEFVKEYDDQNKFEKYIEETRGREEFRTELKNILARLRDEQKIELHNWINNPNNKNEVANVLGIGDNLVNNVIQKPVQQIPQFPGPSQPVAKPPIQQQRPQQFAQPPRQPLLPQQQQQYRKPSPVKNTTDVARYANPRAAEQQQKQKHAQAQRDRQQGNKKPHRAGPPPPNRR